MKPIKPLLQITTMAILMLLVLMTSCKSVRPLPTQKLITTIKDSITTERQTIDTLVIAREADTVKLKETIDKLTEAAIIKRSKHARLSIRRVGNTIEAECHTDELKQVLELQKEIINHYKEITTQKEDTIIIPQKYIPTLLKPLIWIGGITLVLVLGGVAFKLFKPKFL